ncbi:MAG: GumC family protein [Hyphomicrobiaceae bacterium]
MQDGGEDAQTDQPNARRQLIAVANTTAVSGNDHGVLQSRYVSSQNSSREEFARTLQFYTRLVGKHKSVIFATAGAIFALGLIHALMQTPLYTAHVRIQIDREAQKVVEGGGTAPIEQGGREFLRTQYELLKSRAMAERIVSALQLQKDETFLQSRQNSASDVVRNWLAAKPKKDRQSEVELQAAAVGRVVEGMVVIPVAGSRLVDLAFTDSSPARAQMIANAYADAYVAANLDKRFQANAYAKTFLEDQTKQLKIRLEDSEKALYAFAEQEQIVQVNERASISENNLAAANAALGELISKRIKSEQLWRQVAQTDALDVPQFLSNKTVDELRSNRNALSREYEEKLEIFKPGYPAMVQIQNKVKEIDRQLAVEVETIKNSLRAAYQSSVSQETEMKKRIAKLRAEVLDLQRRGIKYNSLKRDVETNRGLYNGLLQRYKEVDVAGGVGTNNVFVIDKAALPTEPTSPRLGRALLLALMVGLGSGLGLAYFLELLDDKIRAPDDMENLFGIPTLGIIPASANSIKFAAELADPRSPVSEAYRSLATSLQFATDKGLPKSISFTSAGPGEGKSTTALAIARHFASMGKNVLLVDTDLRKPSLHENLGLDNSIGLSDYLNGTVAPPEAIQATDYPNLAVMTSGPLPEKAAELLSSPRLSSLVTVGLDVFDLIVIDSPPLLGLADAQIISNRTAATVFTVGSGERGKSAVQSALTRLAQARVKMAGAVLTKFDVKAAGYGYVDSHYAYPLDETANNPQLPVTAINR